MYKDVKCLLFITFLFLSKYFFVPPVPLQQPPPLPLLSSYSPISCNVTNYDFTFIFDEQNKAFKVHGLWAEQCSECLTCGYPYCCNVDNMSFIYPNKSNQIAFLNAQWFNATTREECFSGSGGGGSGGGGCSNKRKEKSVEKNKNDVEVSLFEHEYFKHASCSSAMRVSASEFLEQVMRVYDMYYETHVENQCSGYSQLWLNLDGNFVYNNVTKCL
jgi:hypothetical protein